MPGMDGIEAVFRIRQFLYENGITNQPFIFGVTAHVHEDFVRKGLEAGMDEVISKPLYYQNM